MVWRGTGLALGCHELAGTLPWQQSGVGLHTPRSAQDWRPPQHFAYVNTTLDYVPDEWREPFVHRLLERYVQPGGCLLIAEYLGRSTGIAAIRIDEQLRHWKFSLEQVKSSHLEQDAQAETWVAVLRTPAL